MAQTVERLSTMQKTQVQSLGWEDLENPVFFPGKSHGWRNLVSYSPWGLKESDMTERLHFILYVNAQGSHIMIMQTFLFVVGCLNVLLIFHFSWNFKIIDMIQS